MQPENRRRIRLSALLALGLLAGPASWAQDPKVADPADQEAAQCAGMVSTEPVASDALVAEARIALQGIRSLAPELARVRFAFPAAPGDLLITVRDSLMRRIKQYQGEASAFDFEDKVLNDFRDRYPLRSIDAESGILVCLAFRESSGRYNLDLLAKEVRKSPAVIHAMRNAHAGEEQFRLRPRRDGGSWLLAVERGMPFGGLGARPKDVDPVEVWYFRVTDGKAELVEALRTSDLNGPRVYRWGVPRRFCASVYPSIDKLVETAKGHSDWWHRTHATIIAARLLTSTTSGFGEDDARRYAALRKAALDRKEEILDLLIALLADGDARIREAAKESLFVVFKKDAGDDPKAWTRLRKGDD